MDGRHTGPAGVVGGPDGVVGHPPAARLHRVVRGHPHSECGRMNSCVIRAGFELFRCLAADPECFPPEYQPFLADIAAVQEQESAFNPWALRDESTRESL